MGTHVKFGLFALLCCLKFQNFVECKENPLDHIKTDGNNFNSNLKFIPLIKRDIPTVKGKVLDHEQFNSEDSSYLNRVGWPSLRPLSRDGLHAGKVAYLGNSPDQTSPDRLESFLTSNADHQDQEDSSSRKSNLNIWLTLLIAAVAAAIFS